MTILKLMIVRRVTGYFFFFAQVFLANIYPFLGQNVAKIIGNCEPGRRLVEAPLQPLPYLANILGTQSPKRENDDEN